MNDKYICDDRDILEELRATRNMTEEEFEEYIKALKESEKEEQQ